MHCNICNKMLTEKELTYNEELGAFEPCVECLDIALEAAYSGSFSRDEEGEHEVDFDDPVLDSDFDQFDSFEDNIHTGTLNEVYKE